MNSKSMSHIYGPVPSRRLGRSLGVDLVPFKTCSYDCVYCQLGRTTNKTLVRKEYVAVDEVMTELERRLTGGERPDYISLAGSGEPTLNSRIGDLIVGIKNLTNIPVAVLTNGSLLWVSDVQDALMAADLVLPSLDAGDEELFRYVNRPHRDIDFNQMVEGLAGFTERFSGEVWLEVLLLAGVTGITSEAEKIAALARKIGVKRVQLNTATRPPAESYVFPLSAEQLGSLRTCFSGDVDVVAGFSPLSNAYSAGVADLDVSILALLSRRPCTAVDVANGLAIHVTEAVKHIDVLVRDDRVAEIRKDGGTYFTVINRSNVKRV